MKRTIAAVFALPVILSAPAGHALTPAHIWSKRLGGTASDFAYGLAVDKDDNIIIAGTFGGTVDFGGGPLVSAGSGDIFIAKYTSAGVHVWSERFGSTGSDQANDVAVDGNGNVIVTGQFNGTVDFGGGAIVGPGVTDIFLAKYNTNGVHQWSKGYGGTGSDFGNGVAVDASGDVFVTGGFSSTAVLGDGNISISSGGSDIFIEAYNEAGTFLWNRVTGSGSSESGLSVATGPSNTVLATGYFYNSINLGGGSLVSAGQDDIYLAEYNTAGTHQWSQRFGSTAFDVGQDVATDGAGNVFVAGNFSGTVDFGGGGTTSAGGINSFTASYTSAGAFRWSQHIGGTSSGYGLSVAADATGHALMAGYFSGTVTFDGQPLVSAGVNDCIMARYDPDGTPVWGRRLGGTGTDQARGIAVDAAGNAVVTGVFANTVDFGGGDLTSAGGFDIFLAKYTPDPREPQIISITDVGNDQGRQVAIRFVRSAHDQVGSTRTLLRYEAYRRDDPAPASALVAHDPAGRSSRELLADGWTEVGTVDAHGEPSYGMVVPTVGDSTLALGPYYSTFYVRAATDDPLVFFDSPADSGYSVDNLAPGVPAGFVYSTGTLTWNESAAADFDYFSVYGAATSDFGTATLVNYTVAPTMDVTASPYTYYFVTATDFSGNEGQPATLNALSGTGTTPAHYVLSVSNYPNPFNPSTTVRYTVPSRGVVTIAIYDARGARVATLVDHEERAAGAYRTEWRGRTDSGRSVASGVYFARIEQAGAVRTKKITLLK